MRSINRYHRENANQGLFMLKKIMLLSTLFLSLTPTFSAQANSDKAFIKGFVSELEKVIAEKRKSNEKYCESFQKYKIFSEFTYADNSGDYLVYYKVGNLRIDSFKEMVSQNFECYGKLMPNQGGSLVGAIFNTGAYHKDRDLIDEALENLAGQKVKGHQTLEAVYGIQ